jgi:subtilisin family serine protease
MKKYIRLILVLCFINLYAKAQTQNYYYYQGEKQFFDINTQFAYVQLSQKTSIGELQELWISKNIKVNAVRTDKIPLLLVNSNFEKNNEIILSQYALIEFESDYSTEKYFGLLTELEEYKIVDYCLPFLKNNKVDKVEVRPYVNVKLKNINQSNLLQELSEIYHFEIIGTHQYMPNWNTVRITEETNKSSIELSALLYETNLFEAVEPSLVAIRNSCIGDPLFANQWGLENTGQALTNTFQNGGNTVTVNVTPTVGIDIDACQAWSITKGNPDILVSVVDDGIQLNHPDLDVVSSFDAMNATSPSVVYGTRGHGTSCAGIIKASHNAFGTSGIAPDCGLMAVSVDYDSGTEIEWALAINHSWENGADIISNSWAGFTPLQAVDDAIDNALTQGRNGLGCIVVFGTDNQNNNSVAYPANSDTRILAVGALSPCEERCNPSSCDGETWWGSNFGRELDIVAPGVMIPTTDIGSGTTNFNGTSSATPHIAGVAALILSINPCLTGEEVRNIIENTAQKVGSFAYGNDPNRLNGTWHEQVGYGLVDAFQSLRHTNTLFIQNQVDVGNEGHENVGSIRTGENVDPLNGAITGSYVVENSANVILKATDEIKLEVGTTIKVGAEFRAFIDEFNGECGDWLLPRIVNHNPVVNGNLVDKANIQEENIQQIEVNIFPNPFKNNFNLNIHLTQSDEFSLMVFNATGQLIYTQNGQLDMGKHQLNVPINQTNGLYIVRLQVGSEIVTKKLIKYE